MTVGLALTAALWLAGVVVWRVRLRAALRPTRVDPTDASTLDVSIVVPARNEAHNLPALLASLAALRPAPREVIVVDDQSTDDTADVARAAGVAVVSAPPRPSGWNGKPWACHVGAKRAAGSLVLFTDADTVHGVDSLARAVALLDRERADLVSVIPTHIVRAAWEALQGVFHLLLLVATRAGADATRGERRFSIGQYLLFRRATYDGIGGHETVRGRIAEDLALARAVVEGGGRVAVANAPGMLAVRMYPTGLRAFVAGWRRSFVEGMSSAGPAAVAEITAVIAWLLGAPIMLATALVAGDPVGIAFGGVLYGAAVVDIAFSQRVIGDLPRWSAPLYPLFVGMFAVVSALSTCDRLRGADIQWKDRSLVRTAK